MSCRRFKRSQFGESSWTWWNKDYWYCYWSWAFCPCHRQDIVFLYLSKFTITLACWLISFSMFREWRNKDMGLGWAWSTRVRGWWWPNQSCYCKSWLWSEWSCINQSLLWKWFYVCFNKAINSRQSCSVRARYFLHAPKAVQMYTSRKITKFARCGVVLPNNFASHAVLSSGYIALEARVL